MKDHKAKDIILNHIIDGRPYDIKMLGSFLSIDANQVQSCCDEMIAANHLKYFKSLGQTSEKLILITPSGIHFLNSGGYTKQKNKEFWTGLPKTVMFEIIKLIIAGVLGYFIRVSTEPKHTQPVNNKHIELPVNKSGRK